MTKRQFDLNKYAYTIPEVMASGLTGGHTKTYELIRAGKLRAIKSGGTTLVLRTELDRYAREECPAWGEAA